MFTRNLNYATMGPGWLGISPFAALIRNKCMFLIYSAIVHRNYTKSMVTCIDNVSIQGTRIKLRSVRLLYRVLLDLKSVSPWGN